MGLRPGDRILSVDGEDIGQRRERLNSLVGQLDERSADIVRSRYGICYFSEPAPSGDEHGYVDTPNVIFEAGKLHVEAVPFSLHVLLEIFEIRRNWLRGVYAKKEKAGS